MREKRNITIPTKLIMGIILFLILMFSSGFVRFITAGVSTWFAIKAIELPEQDKNIKFGI